MDRTDDRLEAMSIAMSEWQRLEHMSLDELEANQENYKTPYNVGDKFTVGVNLGEQGFFDNGTCNALTGDYASESPNCFKDTTMTVYDKDGKAMYTTRSLPLSSQSSSSNGSAPAVDWWSNVITKGFSYGSFDWDYGDYDSTVSLTCPEDGYAIMTTRAQGKQSYAYSYVYLNGRTMGGQLYGYC